MAFGSGAFLLRFLSPLQTVLLLATALMFNLLLLNRITGGRLLRERERARGFSWGMALYPGVLLAVVIVFRDRMELAAAVWALVGFGDGMAAICGQLLGGPRLPWNRSKTWIGLVAFVLYGAAMAGLALRWTQQGAVDAARSGGAAADWIGLSFFADGFRPGPLIAGCLAAALAGAIVESLDTRVDDNLTVPLAGGGALGLAAFLAG